MNFDSGINDNLLHSGGPDVWIAAAKGRLLCPVGTLHCFQLILEVAYNSGTP